MGGSGMILARLKMWAIGIGLVLSALAASYFGGRKAANADNKRQELENYVDTRKRMDEVDVGDDPAVLRSWLRERGKPGGGV
jgi:hypothetical protein